MRAAASLFNIVPVVLFGPLAFLGTLPILVLRKQTVTRTLSRSSMSGKITVLIRFSASCSGSSSTPDSLCAAVATPETEYHTPSLRCVPRVRHDTAFRIYLGCKLGVRIRATRLVLLPPRVHQPSLYDS